MSTTVFAVLNQEEEKKISRYKKIVSFHVLEFLSNHSLLSYMYA